MENRIQINGVWYVREKQESDLDVTNFIGCVVEDNHFSFEATKIFKDDKTLYDGIDIKVIDKRSKPHKEEVWDNLTWMINVLNNDMYEINQLKSNNNDRIGSMSNENIKFFKSFLDELLKKGWLK